MRTRSVALAALTVALTLAPATARAALYHCTPGPGDRSFASGSIGDDQPPAAVLPMCAHHVPDSAGDGLGRLPQPHRTHPVVPAPPLRALIVLEAGSWRGTGGVTR